MLNALLFGLLMEEGVYLCGIHNTIQSLYVSGHEKLKLCDFGSDDLSQGYVE